VAAFDGSIVFEQDPNQILDALLPLYMNSQVLRAFQESVASELAARMNAMANASDNAKELKKSLSLSYNRKRQVSCDPTPPALSSHMPGSSQCLHAHLG
jgi:F-type H+-transporting ATPase subunit gamma